MNFIPELRERKTPDLEACDGLTRVLCEVKTINNSEIETNRRVCGSAINISRHLPPEFFRKLSADLEIAERQIAACDVGGDSKRIAYVIINFDDSLHEYAAEYDEQIKTYLNENPMVGLTVVIYRKPSFDTAKV